MKAKPGKQTAVWNYDFSRVRSLACLAIVVLHTFFYSKIAAGKFGYPMSGGAEIASLLFQTCLMWAVPLFVMVTGALLLDPDRPMSGRKIASRYIVRVGGALLLFGLLFIVLDLAMGNLPRTGYGFLTGLGHLLTGHSWSHMWYLYMLLGLYLLLPFFRMMAEHSSERQLRYLLVLLFVFLSLVPILAIWNIETDYRFSFATIFPFYLFACYALHHGAVRLPRWAAWVCFLGGLCATVLITLFGDETVRTVLTGFNAFPVIFTSIGLFSLMTHGAQSNRVPRTEFGERMLRSFDRCSFGIYLLHMVFIKLVFRVWGVNAYAQPWIFVLTILGVTLVSWLAIWLLRFIPGLKKIL